METFWTIQHLDKWNEFERTGILKATPDYEDQELKESYHWMIKQMHARLLSTLLQHTGYPLWAWYRYGKVRRPDLRRRAHLCTGQPGLLIEFKEDMNNGLLSDFIDWHLVLNSVQEIKAWHSIFINPVNPEQSRCLDEGMIQATLWQVVKITPFIAR